MDMPDQKSRRQEPRACGFGESDRRVIDPPPIVEMYADAPNAPPEELKDWRLWNLARIAMPKVMPGKGDKR